MDGWADCPKISLGSVQIFEHIADVPIYIVLQGRHGAEMRVLRGPRPLQEHLVAIGPHRFE
jgi:hypothetical protein